VFNVTGEDNKQNSQWGFQGMSSLGEDLKGIPESRAPM